MVFFFCRLHSCLLSLVFYVVSKYFKLNKAYDSNHDCQEDTNCVGIAVFCQLEGFFRKGSTSRYLLSSLDHQMSKLNQGETLE